MQIIGDLKKMETANGKVVNYYLQVGDDFVNANSLIGKKIEFEYTHQRKCFCGKIVEKTYRNNFCRECFFTLPQASESIFKPELCKAHLNIEVRDLEWEKEFELKPHIVYLAVTNQVKVGITRKTQIPTRWIDQGAQYAIKFAEVPNRYLSGLIEVALKQHVSDKTSWQKMLKEDSPEVDLISIKNDLSKHIPDELKKYFLEVDNEIHKINYPIDSYPKKPKSINLEKESNYSGVLKAIKGQYLIFEDERVINIRSHEGFIVNFTYDNLN
jgi:hypothetical protein